MERYIDRRLEETRRHVRAVDLTVVSLRLSIGVLVYLLVAMVLDHWVLAEGLGKGSRLLLWAGLVLVGGWYCARFLFPLLIHRINPVFAAQTIERTRPTFKNGLINFLLLRRSQEAVQADELSKRVYQGLQVRTASELSRVTVGTTVDRLHVIRLGYLLATLVAICCLYFVVSPKNPLVSFGRVIFPWARIGAPTRVAIDAVEPGNTVAYQGDNLVVSAEIHGLRAGEPVSLYYSSVDGQSVDQSVPMSVPEGGFRYQGELPPGNLGFQQSLLYWIAAGDASSPTFRIDVQIPPAIVVERVEYEYPAYTGLPQRTAVREGDIRAVEGTRVTIHGSANFPVAQAFIELEGDSRPTVRMTADGSTAVGRLTLAMRRSDPSQPEYHWYQLRFTDPERRENRRPIRHRMDVIADQKPEVRFVEPPPEEMQLPVNGSVELKVHAEDPDFGLRRVELRAEREGRGLLIPLLLKKSRPDKPHQGPFEASYLFEPTRWNLKAGDKITYWAEAADCKEKADDPSFVGNLAETERRTILIVAGDPQQKPDKPRSKQGSPQKPKPGQPGDAGEQPNDPMEKPDGQEQPGNAPDKSKPDKDAPPKGRQPQEKPSPEPDQPGQKPKENDSSEDNGAGQGDPSEQKTGGNSGGKPDKGQGKAKSKSKPGESGEPSDTDEPSDSDSPKGDPSQAGKTGVKKDGSGGKAEHPSGPVDGDTNPAEAFERILKDQEQQQAKGQPGGQQKPSKSDSQPSGQEPQETRPSDENRASGNEPSQDNMKAAGKPKKSDTQQSNPDRPAGEEKPGEKPVGKERNGDKPQGTQRPKPSAGAKGMEGQHSEGQDADSNAEDKGAQAKVKSGPKGASGKTKSSDSQDMEQDGGDGQKSDGPQKGAAGKNKKPSGPDKSSAGKPGESGDEGDNAAAKTDNGKQDRKSASPKAARPSDGTEAGKEPDGSEDKGDSRAKKGGTDARKAASKPEKGNSGSEESPTDSQARSGEKPSPGKKNGESKTSDRSEQKGTSPESTGATGEKKDAQSREQQKGPKGAEPQSRPESPGTGEPPNDKSSMPSPQEANKPHGKKQDETGTGKKDDKKGGGDEPSPTISPKTAKTKSDTEGDRSAEGKTGGGQQANQSGEGMPGSQTPSDQGNQGAEQKGEGDTSAKPGEKAMSDQATGKPGDKGAGKGAGSQKRPGGAEPGKQPQKNDPSQKNADAAKGAQPGTESSSGENSGQKGGSTASNPTEGGGEPGKASQNAPPPAPPAPPPDDPNLEYARKQTTLALEHLADQMAKDKSELLERLGWDKAYAENFLRQWEQMRQAANQPGPQGDAAKRELDKALKSLGLRPTKSQIEKAKGPTDKIQQLQGTGRIPPPPEWRDLYRAYNEGVGGSRD